jgi:hypothetical protein
LYLQFFEVNIYCRLQGSISSTFYWQLLRQ